MSKARRLQMARQAERPIASNQRVCTVVADLYWKTRTILGDVERAVAQLKAQESAVQQLAAVRSALLREVSLAGGEAIDPASITSLAYDDNTLTITLTTG